MLQLVYISSAIGCGPGEVSAILATSRRNNARLGITGLLYGDGTRFLQALEGPAAAIEQLYATIRADPRHRATVVLSRRDIAEREFGLWDMAERRDDGDGQLFLAKVDDLTRRAAPRVRATFEGLARVKRAA